MEAARGRVRQVRAELRSPAVEFPCLKCRHYELVCTHPAVIGVNADPEMGTVKIEKVFAKDARSEDGACGPEGVLFDPRSMPGMMLVSMLTSPVGRWALGISGFVAACYLFG
jgi:hypothetical protein